MHVFNIQTETQLVVSCHVAIGIGSIKTQMNIDFEYIYMDVITKIPFLTKE